jgi:hypothetical protein
MLKTNKVQSILYREAKSMQSSAMLILRCRSSTVGKGNKNVGKVDMVLSYDQQLNLLEHIDITSLGALLIPTEI